MTSSPMKLQKRELFGGAIELQVPANFLDVSDFRQVPDTQEVYTTEDGDVSLVVEILDVVKEEGCEDDLWKAINFHFGAIAHDNEALSQQVTTTYESSSLTQPSPLGSYESMRDLSSLKFSTPSPMTLEGTQLIRKFRSERPVDELPPPDKVLIFVALWRVLLENGSKDGRPIPEMDEDENVQDEMGPSAEKGKARGRYADVLCTVNVNVANKSEAEVNEVRAWFKKSSSDMRIRDYGLFVEVEK